MIIRYNVFIIIRNKNPIMIQTDIFTVNRKSEHIIDIENNSDLITKLLKLKPIEKNDYTIYIHNGLYLIVHDKTKDKECFKIQNIKTSINDNLLFMTSKITKLEIDSFPIINKYDDIIKRTVTLYQNNISLIKDTNYNDKIKEIYYLRIKNDTEISIQLTNNFLDAK